MTARAATTTTTAGGLPPGWVSVKDSPYNAKGDNTTDDSAAIQAAINDAKSAATTVAVVYFPPGNYLVGTTLHADNAGKAFSVFGPFQGAQYQESSVKLIYTGANNTLSTGGLLTFNSSSGWLLSNVGLEYNNASFTGHLVQVDGGTGGGDSQDFHISQCTSRARTSITAASIVRLHKAVIGTIEFSHWTGAVNPLRFSDNGGNTSYVVSVQVEKCTFNFGTDAMISIQSGDCEMCIIRDCTFEAGTNTTAIRGTTSNRCYKLVIEGCWFGDAAATIIWVDGIVGQSNAHLCTFRDNMVFLAGTVNDVALKIGCSDGSNNIGMWLSEGNDILGSGNAYDAYQTPPSFGQVIEIANQYAALTNIWKGGGNGFTTKRFACFAAGNALTDLYAPYTMSVRVEGGFTPTLTLPDAQNAIAFTRGGINVIIPTNASAAFPVGTEIVIFNEGSASTGTITPSPAVGVTYYGPVCPTRGSGMLRLVKTATDTWFGQ